MKKLILPLMLSTAALTACSTISNSEPVEKRDDLKHICIKDSANPPITDFSNYLANSLNKKGITSEKGLDYAASCKYVLAYSLRAEDGYVLRAKLRLSEIQGDTRSNIGEVSYKQRGDEKDNVKVTGVQGQTDLMINDLLQNY
ncbi:hypothetical protein ACWA5Z_09755 [Testudinibacter sp. P80/BLE/0925]|uniref:hypothetical protein n=1 Tax=Testudinibacter sp. TW-1 TaxID=3417757 RepID=UPI003D3667EA